MITNFKIYEMRTIDDQKYFGYVLLDLEKIEDNDINDCNLIEDEDEDENDYKPNDKLAKILKFDLELEYPYYIEFPNGKNIYVQDEEIFRNLTPDEIDEFETKKSSKKYNL